MIASRMMLFHQPMLLVLLCVVALVFQNVPEVNAFLIPPRQHFLGGRTQLVIVGSTRPPTNPGFEKKKEKKKFTLKDLAEEIQRKPSAFLSPEALRNNQSAVALESVWKIHSSNICTPSNAKHSLEKESLLAAKREQKGMQPL
jgi:hypothetical protein